MKKVLAAVVAALVVLGAALYFFVARPLLRPSEVTAVVERALATDDLLLLAAVNVKQAVFLEKWFLGAPRATRWRATPRARGGGPHPPRSPARGGRGPAPRRGRRALCPLPRRRPAARHAAVLVGRFNPAAINAYLTRELAATPRPGPGPASYEVTRIDPATCQPGATWMVTVAPGVDRDGRSRPPTPRCSPRLASPPPGSPERLGWWRGLARADVAGVGIPGLDRLESGVTQPFVKGGAKALAGEAGAFGRLYLGLGVKTVPPQGVLRIVIDAKDAGARARRRSGPGSRR